MLDTASYDYDADVFLLDARYAFTEKLEGFFAVSWAETAATIDPLDLAFAPDVPLDRFPSGIPGPGADPGSPLLFADYDLGGIHEYSNLAYTEVRSSLGLNYRLPRNLSTFLSATWYDVEDDEAYLSDASGTVRLFTAGLSWTF